MPQSQIYNSNLLKEKAGTASCAELIASLPPEKRETAIREATEIFGTDEEGLLYCWPFWARPKQLPPEGDWFSWLIRSGRGFGKRIQISEEIKTVKGWKTLGDIVDGDMVYGLNGQLTNVIKAHKVTFVKKAYKLIFDTGDEIIADPEHLWYTINKLEDKRIRRGKSEMGSIKTTEEIINTLKYGGRETNHRIPIAAPLIGDIKELPIKPYTFGVWLGDGDSKSFLITTEDMDILSRIERDGYEVLPPYQTDANNRYPITNGEDPKRNKDNGRYTSNGSLSSLLKKMEVYRNKHIPAQYMDASIAQRYELLKGIMDSDGYVNKTNGWCELSTTKKIIADQVFELVSSLGIKARIYNGDATINGRYISNKYRVMFKTKKQVFSLPRKAELIKKSTSAQMSRHKNRFIVDYQEVNDIPMRCLTVDSSDGLFLITRSFIATHNTRSGAEWVRQKVQEGHRRIAIVGQTKADVRDTMVELGDSSLLNVHPDHERPEYEPSKRRVTWPNGAVAIIYSGDEPDQLRGPQHDSAWVDELAKFKYPTETWDNLEMGLRLGDNPQVCVTTTPRPIPIIKQLIEDPDTVDVKGHSKENINNLSERYIERIIGRYEGTRLGRQELEGEILDDNPNALWKRSMIENCRATQHPQLTRIVIAVDPPATKSDTSDEAGIVAVGFGIDERGYILEDASRKASPEEWAKAAITLYHKYEADRIIGEVNNGGDMVESVIRSVDKTVSYKSVRASRGKQIRAEPISSLYEQGKVSHVGTFPELEDQLCEWQPGDDSPDRLDALVWGCTELMLDEHFEILL